MNIVDCNKCNASKYAGFSQLDNSTEYCLLFDKKLVTTENDNVEPCEECGGKYFKEDEW